MTGPDIKDSSNPYRFVVPLLLLVIGSANALADPPRADPAVAKLQVTVSASAEEPLKGVSVTVSASDGDHERSTNAEGVARFPDLPPGSATVQVGLKGWNPTGKKVSLQRGKRTDVSFTLEPHLAPDEEATDTDEEP